MDDMNLPEDLTRFLSDGRQLDFDPARCETGRITLNGLEDLKAETFNLQTYATPLETEDPHWEDGGYYHIPAVSLVKECEDYEPRFLLVWLPQEGVFGTGDEEHGHLLTFPGVTWTDIVAGPIPYLEANWNPEDGRSVYLRPWPKYGYSAEWAE